MIRAPRPSASIAFGLLVTWAGCTSIQPRYLTSPSRLSIAVIGVRSTVSDPRLADLRVGFGLKDLVAEELYDAGRFRLTEIEPEVRKQLDRVAIDTWQRATLPDEGELDRMAREAGSDLVAFGEIVAFESPRTSMTLGPFSTQTNRLEVTVQVCIRDPAMQTTWCEQGRGDATASATAAAFEFRGDRAVFDRTTVGNAVAGAVDGAVKALMRPR